MEARAPEREFAVRATEAADERALSALYQRLTGRARTSEQWRHDWLEGPFGAAPSWVIVERASGRVVGHHGLMPLELRCGTRVLRAARTENTMVDPELREALYYPAYEAQLLKEYRAHYDVLFTAAGKSVQSALRRRLGYQPVGRWTTITIAETLAFRAAREVGALAAKASSVLGRAILREPDAATQWIESDDLERVEKLWSESRCESDLAPHRTSKFLRWRLATHAWNRFQLALVVRSGRDEAFVAWREEETRGGAKRVLVEDAFARGDDERSLRDAFEQLAWRYRAEPVRLQIRTLERERPLTRAARSISPAWLKRDPEPDEAELLALHVNVPRDATWEATMLLDEGL